MKNFLIILFIIITYQFNAQSVIFEAKDILVSYPSFGTCTISYYNNLFLYKKNKCGFEKNSHEQVFCNFFNINNNKDLNDFFKNKIPKTYSKPNYINSMDVYNKTSNNYYKLDSKYIFNDGLSEDIFIKYLNHNEAFPKPIYSLIQLEKVNKEIMITDGGDFELSLFLISTSTKSLSEFILNKRLPGLFLENNLMFSTLIETTLDCIKNKTENEICKQIVDKEHSVFFNDIKDKKPIKQDKLSDQGFKYVINSQDMFTGLQYDLKKTLKKDIIDKYNLKASYIVQDSLAIREVLNLNHLQHKLMILKFYDSPTLVLLNGTLLESNNIRNNNLLYALYAIDLDIFMSLYQSSNDLKYPETNKLKPLVKDADGTLNISKLAEIIEKNKSSLSKHPDK